MFAAHRAVVRLRADALGRDCRMQSDRADRDLHRANGSPPRTPSWQGADAGGDVAIGRPGLVLQGDRSGRGNRKHRIDISCISSKRLNFKDGEPLLADLPEGWRLGAEKAMRFATINVQTPDKQLEISVSKLTRQEDWDEQVKLNVNRWRGQLGLESVAGQVGRGR